MEPGTSSQPSPSKVPAGALLFARLRGSVWYNALMHFVKERLFLAFGDFPLCFLALGFAHAWLTLVYASGAGALGFDEAYHDGFDYAFSLFSLVIALGVWRFVPLVRRKGQRAIAFLLVCASTALVLGVGALSPGGGQGAEHAIALGLAAVLGGIGHASFLVMYSEVVVTQSLNRAALYTATSWLLAVVIVAFAQGLDFSHYAAIVVLLPAAAFLLLGRAAKICTAIPRGSGFNGHRWFPWKIIGLMAIFAFMYGLRRSSLVHGAGIHSSFSTGAAMVIVIASLVLFSNRFSMSVLSRSPFLLLLLGLLFIPTESLFGEVMSSYCVSMSYSLMSILILLILYDVAKRLGVAISLLVGFKNATQIFVVWGDGSSEVVTGLCPIIGWSPALVLSIVVAVLLLAAAVILLPEKKDGAWEIALFDSGSLLDDDTKEHALKMRCDALARQYRLSPREDEIFRLLAQGRSNAEIEKELFIAAGTLKAHIYHIYTKMDVHSRKELIERINDSEEENATGDA